MTASILKQDPNTKRFKRMLIYFNRDTLYAHFGGAEGERESMLSFGIWIHEKKKENNNNNNKKQTENLF